MHTCGGSLFLWFKEDESFVSICFYWFSSCLLSNHCRIYPQHMSLAINVFGCCSMCAAFFLPSWWKIADQDVRVWFVDWFSEHDVEIQSCSPLPGCPCCCWGREASRLHRSGWQDVQRKGFSISNLKWFNLFNLHCIKVEAGPAFIMFSHEVPEEKPAAPESAEVA